MIIDKDKRKIVNDYPDSFYWVAAPECERPGEKENFLIQNRNKIEIIGGIIDEDASYEYDEFALIKLENKYYLLHTSGCSCPSPSETWSVSFGPCSLQKIKKEILDGNYSGYSLIENKEEELIAVIDSESR